MQEEEVKMMYMSEEKIKDTKYIVRNKRKMIV